MSELRERDWSNIVTCHEHSNTVYTWSFDKKAKSNMILRPPEISENDYALCCEISVCGNFTVVGYKSGSIHMFNIQNGNYRGSLPIGFRKGYIISKSAGSVPDRPAGEGKHTKDVTSVCFDNLNKVYYKNIIRQ